MKDDTEIVLELVHEAKISDLLKLNEGKRHKASGIPYEASGIHLKDGYLHIVPTVSPEHRAGRRHEHWHRRLVLTVGLAEVG